METNGIGVGIGIGVKQGNCEKSFLENGAKQVLPDGLFAWLIDTKYVSFRGSFCEHAQLNLHVNVC